MGKQSATLGLPGIWKRQICFEGNHFDICKFDDWELLLGRIIKMTEDVIKSEQDRTQTALMTTLAAPKVPSN